jgi:hypothetical protein
MLCYHNLNCGTLAQVRTGQLQSTPLDQSVLMLTYMRTRKLILQRCDREGGEVLLVTSMDDLAVVLLLQ